MERQIGSWSSGDNSRQHTFLILQSAPAHRVAKLPYCIPTGHLLSSIWEPNMSTKAEVWQGTLALMVLKTLNAMGPQHGYGIARRIEQTSDNLLSINHGTLYPVLLKLEQEGAIASEWGVSENNRRANFYRLTRAGQEQLASEVTQWAQATEVVARFIALEGVKA